MAADREEVLNAHVRELFTKVNEVIGQMSDDVDEEDLIVLLPNTDPTEYNTQISYGNLITRELLAKWDALLAVA